MASSDSSSPPSAVYALLDETSTYEGDAMPNPTNNINLSDPLSDSSMNSYDSSSAKAPPNSTDNVNSLDSLLAIVSWELLALSAVKFKYFLELLC